MPTSDRTSALLLPRSGRARSSDSLVSIRFADRHDAGRQLAAALKRFREQRPVVVAIPRGGVPVAAEIARALDAPLDVMVRKIGAPWQPEYAIGAVAEGGVLVLARRELSMLWQATGSPATSPEARCQSRDHTNPEERKKPDRSLRGLRKRLRHDHAGRHERPDARVRQHRMLPACHSNPMGHVAAVVVVSERVEQVAEHLLLGRSLDIQLQLSGVLNSSGSSSRAGEE